MALCSKYAISLSVQQLVAVLLIIFLTFLNTLGVQLGKIIQNMFTSAKTLSLLGLIFLCVFVGRNAAAISDNFSHFWAIRDAEAIAPGADFLRGCVPTVTRGRAGRLDCLWPLEWRRWGRCFPRMRGTTLDLLRRK